MANERAEDGKEGIRYVAFLRGINVGGHRLIKMTELARIFSEMGLADVRTVIASGNVLFASDEPDEGLLATTIERALEEALGYEVDVMLRSIERLQNLVKRDPFVKKDAEVHAYVTFLKNAPQSVPKLPADFPEEAFAVLAVDDREIFWMSSKLPNGRYGDSGKYFAKAFGKIPVTTRNWNTVVKIAGM